MKTWEIEADGIKHEIKYKKGFTNKIIVDGETHKVKSSNMFLNVIDYEISFGSTNCNLVVVGTKIDLAVNGSFLGSHEEYKPLNGVSSWIWILVGISTLGGMILSGIISLLIGLLMSTLYIQFDLSKKKGAVIASFIACSILQIILLFALVILRS
ncbi:hypothetical protein SAMN02745163_01383 [Clostridium cavendishii DSM 21758]|uniref:Uncharacterized protein n=1 Tax=Clostridium cavendishii DSM 21758 TaxID=1121302 RepID=A0A1M6GTS1_9CLOT|nr:hypothetical protein [Clostridium cavendishii]SHJ13289.1 hypothetical protein SAMN02745163_01383 [Clostridium cavendishii DSM 21758]